MGNGLEGDSHTQQCSVKLQGSIAYENKKESIEHTVCFQLNKSNESTGFMKELAVHRLAGKNLIQEKQDRLGDSVNNEEIEAIIKVSRSTNVVSKFTAFVAVNKESHEPIPCAMLRQAGQSFSAGILCQSSFLGSGDLSSMPTKLHALDRATFRSSVSGRGSVGLFRQMRKSAPEIRKMRKSAPEIRRTVAFKIVTKFSLVDIVALQKASGAWEMTKELAQQCGSTLADLQHACPDTLPTAENAGNVWATALALVVLANKFNDRVDEWEMVGKKAKKWLKRQFAGVAEYQNVIFAAANALGMMIPTDFS